LHIACGGVPYECTGQIIEGGGSESWRFSLDEPQVREVAEEALLEYANCMSDEWCRTGLPTLSLAINYTDLTVDKLALDSDRIMEAVAYYVDKHMQYLFDPEDLVENACDIEEDLHTQSAIYTIEESGTKRGRLQLLFLFNTTNTSYTSFLNAEIMPLGLRALFARNGYPFAATVVRVHKVNATKWTVDDVNDYEIVKSVAPCGTVVLNVHMTWAAECPKDYCGDCEDHAVFRAALLKALGISSECVYCAEYWGGYWGQGGHGFNLVNYRNKWRIMDYGTLGTDFKTNDDAHKASNIWNDVTGEIYCPNWRDNLGDGSWDCGCEKTPPSSYTWNYVGGTHCPLQYSTLTYRTDICP